MSKIIRKIYRDWPAIEATLAPKSSYAARLKPGIVICNRPPDHKGKEIKSFWHPSFMDCGNNVKLIDVAINDCLLNKCDIIFLVTDYPCVNLFRNHCKDFTARGSERAFFNYEDVIPINYVNSQYIKNNPVQMFVKGIEYVYHYLSKLSYYIKPMNFYVNSPYGIYDSEQICLWKESHSDRRYLSTWWQHRDRSFLTGVPMPAIVGLVDFLRIQRHIYGMRKRKENPQDFAHLKIPEVVLGPQFRVMKNKKFFYDCSTFAGIAEAYKDPLASAFLSGIKRPKYIKRDTILFGQQESLTLDELEEIQDKKIQF